MRREALPLILIIAFVIIHIIISTVIKISVQGVGEGNLGDFAAFSIMGFYLLSILIIVVLGLWAIIRGIIQIKNKTDIKIGIANLIVGIIVIIPQSWRVINSLTSSIGT